MDEQKKNGVKRFTGDLLYGIVSLVAMNAVLSLGVYPYLQKQLGEAGQGRMLFFTALMGLTASAVGSGINYGRMKMSTEHTTKNADYNRYLVVLALISCAVAIVGYLLRGEGSGATLPGIFLLIFATSVRYYADVEYRLTMNYRGFFFYYMLVAAGYVVGVFLYRFTRSWVLIFLCGEFAGLLFVFLKGHIFRPFWGKKSEYFKEDAKACAQLSAAYLMSDFVSYADRLCLSLIAGDIASDYYYIAGLVGKMTSLLSTPLNGVITGHLAHYRGKITRKKFAQIFGLLTLLAVALAALSILGSHIFVYLFYRDQYESVKSLFVLANTAQVFFFLANTMMVVVLRFAEAKVQMILGAVYCAMFFGAVLPLMWFYGLRGAAWGLLIINIVKFLLISAMGFAALGKDSENDGK